MSNIALCSQSMQLRLWVPTTYQGCTYRPNPIRVGLWQPKKKARKSIMLDSFLLTNAIAYRESVIYVVRGSSHQFYSLSSLLFSYVYFPWRKRSEQLTLLGWGSCEDLFKNKEWCVAVVIYSRMTQSWSGNLLPKKLGAHGSWCARIFQASWSRNGKQNSPNLGSTF